MMNKKRTRDKTSSKEKPLGDFLNMNLNYFISKLKILKNSPNYKNKGPYIYCAVSRFLNLDRDLAELLYVYDCYHAGIFECTKKILIHYGEEDENGNKKPLLMEKKEDDELNKYQVRKFFFSKEKPNDFFNLIDINEWTSEKYDTLLHNCIHCVNEYLILNNVYPINFIFFFFSIAYFFLCNECYNKLTPERKKKLYIKNDIFMDISDGTYQIYQKDGDIYETNLDESNSELAPCCMRCMDGTVAQWRFDKNLLQTSGEESKFIFAVMGGIEDIIEDIKHDIKKELEEEFKEICTNFKINISKKKKKYKTFHFI